MQKKKMVNQNKLNFRHILQPINLDLRKETCKLLCSSRRNRINFKNVGKRTYLITHFILLKQHDGKRH